MSIDTDPEVRALRERLSELDAGIVDAVNARLELVAELKRLKEERGYDFYDPERERWLLEHLAGSNRGPLSDDGVRELVRVLLDLTKREVAG